MRPLILLLLLTATLTANAQSTQQALETRLLAQPLYLRGLWQSDQLSFDATGHLKSKTSTGSFTTSGLSINKVTLKPDRLILHATRMGIIFPDGVLRRTPIMEPSDRGISHTPQQLELKIDAPATADYTPLLDALLTPDLAELAPTLPPVWRIVEHRFPTSGETLSPFQKQTSRVSGTERVGGTVLPPKPLQQPEPTFSPEARATGVQGKVLVYLQVDTSGMPVDIRILKPVGMGLDERAAAAVSQYRFQPATRNGVPVAVEMNVEVSFAIF